jgi:hypothetical protein
MPQAGLETLNLLGEHLNETMQRPSESIVTRGQPVEMAIKAFDRV